MENRIERILGKCTDDEGSELDILQRAVSVTQAAYQNGYSEADLKKWNAAKVALADRVAGLVAKHFPAERCFEHRKAAHDWLEAQGYKIKKSKFYADCAALRCVVEGDGTVRESAVLAYAAEHLRRIQDEDGNLTPLTEEKTKLEIENLQAKAERARFELRKEKKKYVRRQDANRELAARGAVLDQGVQNFFRTRVPDMVSMCGGDAKKVSTVMDYALGEWNALLAEYVDIEQFNVVFEED